MSLATCAQRRASAETTGSRRANPAAAETAPAGMPRYLGGTPRPTRAPAFLQRQPASPTQELDEEAQVEGRLQRLALGGGATAGDEEGQGSGLAINRPGDAFELEADRVADAALRGSPLRPGAAPRPAPRPAPRQLQRKCAACARAEAEGREEPCPACAGEARGQLQRKGAETAPRPSRAAVAAVRNPGPGSALPGRVRARVEPVLGRDLSGVRVHTDAAANVAARSIGARAFTHGQHIWLGPGESAGDVALMGHEATHTVQQSPDSQLLQRDIIDDIRREAERRAEEFARERLGVLSDKPVGPPSGFVGDPSCHVNFCQPFADPVAARADLAWAGPLILAGIARRVNSRVVPLWARYLAGGTAPLNLSSDFGADFTASPTTAETTRFLIDALRQDVEANHAALMGASPAVAVDFTPRLRPALDTINNPLAPVPPQMNFAIPSDIAGNVAGGIGVDQLSHPIGARPSPFNDAREAVVRATLVRQPNGDILVIPVLSFTVRDTIDLCPGNCGTGDEQVATVPLSRFEATGLTGDVPFTIEFPAPPLETLPFTVTPAAPPAPAVVTGTVTASSLRIRAAPDLSAPILGHHPAGTTLTLDCQVTGAPVDGNDVWYRTGGGFVSGRYVTVIGGSAPVPC
jgi:hypothetical protein